MVRQGMRHRGTAYSTTQPGDYTVRVTATAGGKTIGTARARFLVQSQDLELANAGADLALLHLLAKMTEPAGGKVVAHEQLANLLEELGESPEQWNIEIPTLWTFGRQRTDGALLLLAMVGLMSVEWFLRKRWGLV
jgi:hypothetical protein